MLHAGKHGFVVLVTQPLQSGEDGGRIFARSESGVVVEEAFSRFERQPLVVVVHDLEVEWIASLVAAVPEVRHAAHVRVSGRVDGRDEPLRLGLCVVGDRLANILLRIGFAVAVHVVVCLNPVVQFQLHRMADLVLNQHLNRLLVGGGFVGIVLRSHNFSFRMGSIDEVRPAPFGVGRLDNIGVLLVVGLHFVGQPVGNVDAGQVDGDEERAVVVGRVSCCLLNVAVAGHANVKGAVFGSVIGVLEPHGTHEVELFACSHPRTVLNVLRSQFSVVVPDVQPSQSKRSVDPQAVFGHERSRCKACGAAVVQAPGSEADVVLVGHFAGHEELPVNLKDAVALDRIRRGVHLNVLTGIVGVREHVPVLPRERGPIGHGPRHEGQFSADHGGGVFANNVARDHFVRRDAFVQNFAFWNGDVKVHRLHRVGDLEGFQNQNTRGFRREVDVNFSDAGPGIWDGIVEFVEDGVARLLRGHGCGPDQGSALSRTLPCALVHDGEAGLVRSIGVQGDGEAGDGRRITRRRG